VSEKTSENENGKIIVRKNGFVAEINNDSAAIIAYEGDDDRITIPEKIMGKPVTHIADYAFKEKGLTEVSLPSSLKTIGKRSFEGNYIKSLRMEEGLLSIGEMAFYNNQISLYNEKLPSTLISIGDHAFSHNRIMKLEMPVELTSIGYGVFSDNLIKELHIPNGVTAIGYKAFAGNKIRYLVIPDSVTNIEAFAFEENPLFRIAIPANVKQDFIQGSKPDPFVKFYNENGKKAGKYVFDGDFWNFWKDDKIRRQKEERDLIRIRGIIEKYGEKYAEYNDDQIRQLIENISKPIGPIPEAVWNELNNYIKIWYYELIDKYKAEVCYHEKGFGYITYPVIQIVYDKKSTSIFTARDGYLKLTIEDESFNFFNDPPEVCLGWIERIGEKHPDIKEEIISTLRRNNDSSISYSRGENLCEHINFQWGTSGSHYCIDGDKVDGSVSDGL
jgi:hypothetical protein